MIDNKSSAERAHRWTRDAHRARGIAWTLFMRQERGPRLDMELVDGSGKGVGEEESGNGGRTFSGRRTDFWHMIANSAFNEPGCASVRWGSSGFFSRVCADLCCQSNAK